jgi:hypothetical protein
LYRTVAEDLGVQAAPVGHGGEEILYPRNADDVLAWLAELDAARRGSAGAKPDEVAQGYPAGRDVPSRDAGGEVVVAP